MPDYTDPNPNPGFPEPQGLQDKKQQNATSASAEQSQKTTPEQISKPAADSETSAEQPQTTSQNTSTLASPSKTNTPQTQAQDEAPTSQSPDHDVRPQTPQKPAEQSAPSTQQKQDTQQTSTETSIITNESPDDSGSGSGSKIKKFALPVLGILLLVGAVGTGVVLVGQNQNIEEEASEDCVPPTAGNREWWSVEIGGNHNTLPPSDSGQITGLEPGTTEVVVESWSDSAFGCGTNQQDESAQVQVNGQTVTVTDTDVPGSTTTQVQIGQDGVLNITATALGDPGSMFVFVRVPAPAPVACEIPPADGRLILNFTDDNSLLQSLQEAQSLDFNTEGESFRVLIQIVNAEGNKEFFVVLIDNTQDSVFITRTDSIDSLPNDLESYEQLSDDNITLSPDASSLEAMINAHTGQNPESISVICASFEEYDLQASPTPTEGQTQYGATCEPVRVYDLENNQLSNEQLSQLTPGDTVRFQVTYQVDNQQSTVDKARFRINQGEWIVTTDSSSNGTFYLEYEIPENITSFEVDGQVHILENDTWY